MHKITPAAIFALILMACGSSNTDVLFIETHTSLIKVGDRISLTAQATELLENQMEWDVLELGGGSLVRTTGQQVTYVAPQYAGTYHVAVRAMRTNGQRARAVQTIIVQPQLSIEPTAVKLMPGASYTFTLKARGVDSTKIQWSIDEPDGGTITSLGVYTAPARRGAFTVAATAMTEGRPSTTAVVNVE
ncbi:MAG: hypothetical protein LBC63_04465 [Holophagales bacterium]|nr:hypothetical protein [Holophagales bacterium]